jgi:DNA replication protein DnaD
MEAEETYPMVWIEQAIRIAVENNVRRWRYVEAILQSWKERGRDEKDRRDTQEDAKRFLDGEFGQFFKTG